MPLWMIQKQINLWYRRVLWQAANWRGPVVCVGQASTSAELNKGDFRRTFYGFFKVFARSISWNRRSTSHPLLCLSIMLEWLPSSLSQRCCMPTFAQPNSVVLDWRAIINKNKWNRGRSKAPIECLFANWRSCHEFCTKACRVCGSNSKEDRDCSVCSRCCSNVTRVLTWFELAMPSMLVSEQKPWRCLKRTITFEI